MQSPDRINLEYNTIGINPDASSGFFHTIYTLFNSGGAQTSFQSFFHSFISSAYFWWEVYSVFALAFSGLLLYGIIYSRLRLAELGHIYHEQLHHAEEEFARIYGGHKENARYEAIEQHVASDNPNDWRLAIIEADIVLEELLDQRGFHGTTIGDRLKSASHATLHTLDDAWEAHKVRNNIAHRGGDFILTKRVAQETITRFQRVFAELGADHSEGDHSGGQGH